MPPPNKKYTGSAKKSRRQWRNQGFKTRGKGFPKARIGVAEGDSWFDYSPAWIENPSKGDLLAQLMQTKRYNIYRVSDGGDTLENMVYGTEFKNQKTWKPERAQLLDTVAIVKKLKPEFFLFSGGGNDFAGPELEGLLNHKETGRNPIRADVADYIFGSYIPACYQEVIDRIQAAAPGIHIFLHGYGHADPTGKAVINFPFGWKFVGPWLRPALTKKRHTAQNDRRAIIKDVVDRFNAALKKVANANSKVHYIDLRNDLNYNDWKNELHLDSKGWGKVATAFDRKISKVLPPK